MASAQSMPVTSQSSTNSKSLQGVAAGLAGSRLVLKCSLHAQLIRAVCTLPALQTELLPQLVSFLSAGWKTAGEVALLMGLIPDLVDAVHIAGGPLGRPTSTHTELHDASLSCTAMGLRHPVCKLM